MVDDIAVHGERPAKPCLTGEVSRLHDIFFRLPGGVHCQREMGFTNFPSWF